MFEVEIFNEKKSSRKDKRKEKKKNLKFLDVIFEYVGNLSTEERNRECIIGKEKNKKTK